MDTVKELLDIKGHEVLSIQATESVYAAIEMMAKMEVGALTVLDENGLLAGIISERDYARKIILKGKTSIDTNITDIMTSNVISVGEETTADKCLSLMSQKKIRHLPVLKRETLVGIITAADLMKFVVKKQSMAIEELESYIMGETGGSG
jgi:CBS domain-containing protein